MSDEHSESDGKRGQNLPAKAPFEPVVGAYEFSSAGDNQQHSPRYSAESAPRKPYLPFDPRRIITVLKLRWRWLLWSGAAVGLVGLLFGWVTSECRIQTTLVLRDVSTTFSAGAGDSYRPGRLAVQTLVDLMTSPELARRVAAKSQPPVSEETLRRSVTATLGHEKDLVTLTLTGRNRRELVSLAELYANEAIQMGREQQLAEVSRMNQFFRDRIAATGAEMARINDEMVAFQKETGTIDPESEAQAYTKQLGELLTKADNLRIELEVTVLQVNALQAEMVRQTPLAQKLEAAKARLSDLLSRYTEAHPTVKAQREQIAALERQLAGASANSFSTTGFAGNTLGGTLYLRLIELQTRKATLGKELQALDSLKQSLQDKVTGISKTGLGYAVIKARLDSQKNSLSLLANRQREAQLYEDNAQGYFRLLTQPKANDVVTKERWVKSFSFALTGFVLGVLGAMFVVAAREVTDGRLKTAADVERVTGLRVLASLNDLNAMTSSQREQWAFRTWTALSGQLSASANRGMVCGFMSSTSGEGCSTWIKLLADAAAQRGLRVLTVDAQATSAETETQTTKAEESPVHSALLTPQVLASPANVARQFAGANVPAVARVPLAGWVWNLERRKQWQSAMAQWQAVDDLVLLVELPPASAPEAVLLAESLPRVLWLVGSGRPRTRETRQQLETLRHAKCRLAGAVLNHEPEPVFSL